MNVLRTSARALLAVSVMTAGFASAQEIEMQGLSAPPYWSSPAASPQGHNGRSALVAGRQSLVTSPVPLPFVAITPCRQHDSRTPAAPLLQGTPQTLPLIGGTCGIPADAQAVAANITIVNIFGAGGNGVFKVGITSPPTVGWINYPPTETQRANAGVLPLGAGGTIVVGVAQGGGSVDVIVDVFGYYSPLGIVNSLNGLAGDLSLVAGTNVILTPSGSTLTIASSGSGAAGATGATGPQGIQGLTGATGASSAGAGAGLMSGGTNSAGLVAKYVPFVGYAEPGGPDDEAYNSTIMATSCLADFRVRFDEPTNALPVVFTLRVNGVDTTTKCTLQPSDTECSSSPSSPNASILAGNFVVLKVTGASNYGYARFYWVALKCQ